MNLTHKVVPATPPHSSSSPSKVTIEDDLGNENFFLPAPSFRESYECQFEALKEVSLQNGMTNEWKKYEPKFRQHLDAWKKCESLTGILRKLWYEYWKLVIAKIPHFWQNARIFLQKTISRLNWSLWEPFTIYNLQFLSCLCEFVCVFGGKKRTFFVRWNPVSNISDTHVVDAIYCFLIILTKIQVQCERRRFRIHSRCSIQHVTS